MTYLINNYEGEKSPSILFRRVYDMNGKKAKFTLIEDILNIYDTRIVWYSLLYAGFRGYEVSNTGLVRSLKFKKKYPYGILIKPDRVSGIYELSDNNRCKLSLEEIMQLVKIYPVPGYPRETYIIDIGATRSSCTVTRGRRNKSIPSGQHYNEERFYPKFTIIGE